MSAVGRSLESLVEELSDLDRRRRRVLDAIAEHPDSEVEEHPLETACRVSSRQIDEALTATAATIARIQGRSHLAAVESDLDDRFEAAVTRREAAGRERVRIIGELGDALADAVVPPDRRTQLMRQWSETDVRITARLARLEGRPHLRLVDCEDA